MTCIFLSADGETARPRYSAADAVSLYFDHGAEIFSLPLHHRLMSVSGLSDEKYPAAGLEKTLKQYFGESWMDEFDQAMFSYGLRYPPAAGDVLYPARRPANQNPQLSRSRCGSVRRHRRRRFFEVASIFSQTNISYPIIDGGVFANNPALCAYAEARKLFGARAAEMAILSLGTGTVP